MSDRVWYLLWTRVDGCSFLSYEEVLCVHHRQEVSSCSKDIPLVQFNVVPKTHQKRVPIVLETTESGLGWMWVAKMRMEERHQMTKVSVGGKHTVASRRRSRQVAAKRGYAQISTKAGNEQITNVINGGLDFIRTPACYKKSAGSRRWKTKTCRNTPVDQSWMILVRRDAEFWKKMTRRQSYARSRQDIGMDANSGTVPKS